MGRGERDKQGWGIDKGGVADGGQTMVRMGPVGDREAWGGGQTRVQIGVGKDKDGDRGQTGVGIDKGWDGGGDRKTDWVCACTYVPHFLEWIVDLG